MSRSFSKALAAGVLVVALGLVGQAQTVTITNYLWFFPHVPAASVSATTQIARLRVEIQKILTLGNGLSIVQYDHHDRAHDEQYWVYVKPGRMIATLAWAYPYLTTAQKASVNTYVTTELANATFQPWSGTQLQPGSGTTRELFPITTRTYSDSTYSNFPTYTPVCEQLYGLWLWGWRKGGDWSQITTHQTAIRNWYTSISATCAFYGGMGAHIAKARLESSTIWNNSGNQTTATNALQTAMNNGLNFGTTEALLSNCTTGLWRLQYCAGSGVADTRKQNGQYLGWLFYGLAPEVARYLATETFTNPANGPLARNTSGKAKYSLWWLRQAGYDQGHTGIAADIEGSGISPETICMIAPMERWAVGASSSTMLTYTRSGPMAVGDHCWLELLVYAIESTGTMSWVDTRSGHPGT